MIGEGDIRRLALACPGAVEADHHGIPSFRVGGKIFATIRLKEPRLMVKLDPEDQHNLAEAHPGVVEPVPGSWGRKGSTFVAYLNADAALITTLLGMAYAQAVAKLPKSRRPVL
jgi:predicted DNA-binding protein (MmcQ/YjbR family)